MKYDPWLLAVVILQAIAVLANLNVAIKATRHARMLRAQYEREKD